jgi:hypothetical protein
MDARIKSGHDEVFMRTPTSILERHHSPAQFRDLAAGLARGLL